MRPGIGILVVLLACPGVAGCGQRMIDQPRRAAYETTVSPFDDVAPPSGAVSQQDAAYLQALEERPELTLDLMERGQHRFDIYCAPCHGRAGDGNGIIVAHGMPSPPSYADTRLRDADPAYFVHVMTHGYGAMYSYADKVNPADRWAIAAYIKALQLTLERTDNDEAVE